MLTAPLRLQAQIFNLGVQSNLIYPWNFLLRVLVTFVPLLATLGAALIQFFFCFTLAMIAFWILDIGSVTFIVYSVEFLLGGHIFPVDAFPVWLQIICLRLPFAYETWFPAAILIGHVD